MSETKPASLNRKRRRPVEKSKTELELEAAVFSVTDASTFAKNAVSAAKSSLAAKSMTNAALFSTEAVEQADAELGTTHSGAAWADEDDDAVQVAIADVGRTRKLRETQDERVVTGQEYQARLKQQFEKTSGGAAAAWAEAAPAAAAGDGEAPAEGRLGELLRTTTGLTATGGATDGATLPSGTIAMDRVRDANHADPAKSVVTTLRWHPTQPLLAVGSQDKRVRFFRADGTSNRRLLSVFCEDMPVRDGGFTAGGREFIATGRRAQFYSIDVEKGAVTKLGPVRGRSERSWESVAINPHAMGAGGVHALLGSSGHVALIAADTKQLVGDLKMTGQCRAATWCSDGHSLITVDNEGQVYYWDVRNQALVYKHADQGARECTSVAVSPTGSALAVGSTAGVVNMYSPASLGAGFSAPSFASLAATEAIGNAGTTAGAWDAFAPIPEEGQPSAAAAFTDPTPVKTVMNLTTAIDHLGFNHDGSILALASQRLKDQLRLLHVPSGTVFSNWPTASTPLNYINSLAFSNDSKFLALGNARGRVLLYSLRHYAGSVHLHA